MAAPVQPKQVIAMYSFPHDDGKGDIAYVKTCVQKINKERADCFDFLIFTTKASLESIANSLSGLDCVSVRLHNPESANISEVALNILCPYTGTRDLPSHCVMSETPLLLITENGVPLPNLEFRESLTRSLKTGIGDEKDGIFVNPLDIGCDGRSSLQAYIPKVSEGLRAKVLQGKSIEEFERSTLLYFSYTSSPAILASFLLERVSIEHQKKKDLLFVFPNKEEVESAHLSTILDKLRQYHVKSISFNEGEARQINTEGINIRCITDCIDGEDFAALIYAAERQMCLTGDHSIALGFCRNAQFVYEARGHKRDTLETMTKYWKERHKLPPPVIKPNKFGKVDVLRCHRDIKKIFEDSEGFFDSFNQSVPNCCTSRLIPLIDELLSSNSCANWVCYSETEVGPLKLKDGILYLMTANKISNLGLKQDNKSPFYLSESLGDKKYTCVEAGPIFAVRQYAVE